MKSTAEVSPPLINNHPITLFTTYNSAVAIRQLIVNRCDIIILSPYRRESDAVLLKQPTAGGNRDRLRPFWGRMPHNKITRILCCWLHVLTSATM